MDPAASQQSSYSKNRPWFADGRLIVLLLLLIYAGAWRHFDARQGWTAAWRHFRVAGMEPPMADMRSTLGAFESYRKGVPMAEIQKPVAGSPTGAFTYPQSWMIFAPLGLTVQSTGALTLGSFVAGMAAWFAFTGPITLLDGLFYGLISISPSLMLGVERGNVDLILFVLILVACALAAQRSLLARIFGNGLFFLGGVLKIYPIAGLSAALKTRRSAWPAMVCGVLFAGFLYLDRADLQRVMAYTPRDIDHSFGARVFTDAKHLPNAYGYAAAGLVMLAAVTLACTRRLPIKLEPNRFGTAFLACSSMYLLCFLIGNNYIYRYRLFLLILPQALIWARQKFRPAAVLAAGILLTAFAANESRLWILSEALNWMLFGLLVYLSMGMLRVNLDSNPDISISQ